ncbi:hypothetical protein E2C01_004583 [Portunus trituberculatus]|uniref:Uncharacterized protein n=1 Tax=Portunus trituberculatus TaxID=210409 RepID=A0A5B7CQX0_PORTR|nr:hypothetical protein [Portunus trituberculatus]
MHNAPSTKLHHTPSTMHHAAPCAILRHAPNTKHHAPCTMHHAPCTVHHAASSDMRGLCRSEALTTFVRIPHAALLPHPPTLTNPHQALQ